MKRIQKDIETVDVDIREAMKSDNTEQLAFLRQQRDFMQDALQQADLEILEMSQKSIVERSFEPDKNLDGSSSLYSNDSYQQSSSLRNVVSEKVLFDPTGKIGSRRETDKSGRLENSVEQPAKSDLSDLERRKEGLNSKLNEAYELEDFQEARALKEKLRQIDNIIEKRTRFGANVNEVKRRSELSAPLQGNMPSEADLTLIKVNQNKELKRLNSEEPLQSMGEEDSFDELEEFDRMLQKDREKGERLSPKLHDFSDESNANMSSGDDDAELKAMKMLADEISGNTDHYSRKNANDASNRLKPDLFALDTSSEELAVTMDSSIRQKFRESPLSSSRGQKHTLVENNDEFNDENHSDKLISEAESQLDEFTDSQNATRTSKQAFSSKSSITAERKRSGTISRASRQRLADPVDEDFFVTFRANGGDTNHHSTTKANSESHKFNANGDRIASYTKRNGSVNTMTDGHYTQIHSYQSDDAKGKDGTDAMLDENYPLLLETVNQDQLKGIILHVHTL